MGSTLTQHFEQELPATFDVAQAFQALTQRCESPTALLESACINTRIFQKSVMMLSAALRIQCFGESVKILALNENGRQLLSTLRQIFPEARSTEEQIEILISHESIRREVDEQRKLRLANVFDVLRKILTRLKVDHATDETTQLIGTFGFDCFDLFEPVAETFTPSESFPYYDFFLADRLIIVDHQGQKLQFVSKIFPGPLQTEIGAAYQQHLAQAQQTLAQLPPFTTLAPKNISDSVAPSTNINDERYCELVGQLKEHISQGDIFQVVLARHFTLPCHAPFRSYQELKESNPSPYMFYVATPDYTLFGSSPESAVKFETANRRVTLYPIAGTRKRGLDEQGRILPELDSRLEMELKRDNKENAEHAMLVDLARNDIAKVSEPGSRSVDRLMEIDRYSRVMHLVSKVSGRLRDELDALSAYQACMNMGTLTGAPKVRATQLIRQYEPQRRGVYGGAVGYLNASGDMDTAIVIRSAFVKDGIADVTAGAGIVHDSTPQGEAQETRDKAEAVCRAIQRANQRHAPRRNSTPMPVPLTSQLEIK